MSTLTPDVIRLIQKGRKAEQRGKAVEGCITHLLVVVVVMFLRGLWLMLAVGVIHDHWWPEVPTIGYWWAVLIVALLHGVFSIVPSSSKKDGAS